MVDHAVLLAPRSSVETPAPLPWWTPRAPGLLFGRVFLQRPVTPLCEFHLGADRPPGYPTREVRLAVS
jgi:hypothetical protein